MSVHKDPRSPYWHYNFQINGQRYYGSTKCKNKRDAAATIAGLGKRFVNALPPAVYDGTTHVYIRAHADGRRSAFERELARYTDASASDVYAHSRFWSKPGTPNHSTQQLKDAFNGRAYMPNGAAVPIKIMAKGGLDEYREEQRD